MSHTTPNTGGRTYRRFKSLPIPVISVKKIGHIRWAWQKHLEKGWEFERICKSHRLSNHYAFYCYATMYKDSP